MIVAKVSVNLNPEGVLKAVRAKARRNLGVVARDLADRIRKNLRTSNSKGLFTATPGEYPNRGSGDLIRSIYAEQIDPDTWHVGTRGTAYGRMQELGGIIQSAKWMWIPTSREATAHRAKHGTVAEFRSTHKLDVFFPRRGDYGLAVERSGRQETIHFVLKKRVYMPAHPFLRPAVHDPEWKARAAQLMGSGAAGVEAEHTQESIYTGHTEQYTGY